MIRLNKLIADSGLCSRRQADIWIAEGRVKVGRQVAVQGQQVEDASTVRVDGKPLPVSTKRYLAFHKPTDVITSRADEKKRKTIYDLLPPECQSVDPAGRLDRDSSGLLILSNDGDFLHRVMHPSFKLEKSYRVTLNKGLKQAHAKELMAGIMLAPEGKVAKVHRLETTDDPFSYIVVLVTGYNRQIRRSFEAVGYTVSKLKRTGFGPIRLGQLAPGRFRDLSPLELKRLGLMPTTEPKQGQKEPKQKDRPVKDRVKQPGQPKRPDQKKRRQPKV